MKIVLEHPHNDDVYLDVDANIVNACAVTYKGEIYVYRYLIDGESLTFEWIPEPVVVG